jgi:hypothetical protein
VFRLNKFIVLKFGLFIGKCYDNGGLFCLSVIDDCSNVANSISCSELNVGDQSCSTFVMLILIVLFICLSLI